MPTPTRRSWRSMAVASEVAAPRHINHHVRATAISPPPHTLRSDGAHSTTPIAPCSKVRIAQPKRKVRRVRRSLVISEGAFRVKGVSPEVSPLEGRVGLGGLGWPVRCGVSSVVAVARCALHGVSPECRVTVISSPRRGGMVWFGSRSGGRNQGDGHARGGGHDKPRVRTVIGDRAGFMRLATLVG